jgi:hypothetical protein
MEQFFNYLAEFINKVGFPIFVAVWSLIKSSDETKQLREAITDLKIAIVKLYEKKGDDSDDIQ